MPQGVCHLLDEVLCLGSHRLISRQIQCRSGIVAVGHEEWSVAGAGVDGIVDGEFSQVQMVVPVILSWADEVP